MKIKIDGHRKIFLVIGLLLIIFGVSIPNLQASGVWPFSTLIVDTAPPLIEKYSPTGTSGQPTSINVGTTAVSIYISAQDPGSGVGTVVYDLALWQQTGSKWTPVKGNVTLPIRTDTTLCQGVSFGYSCYQATEIFGGMGEPNAPGTKFQITTRAYDNASPPNLVTLISVIIFGTAPPAPSGTYRVCVLNCSPGASSIGIASGDLATSSGWYSVNSMSTILSSTATTVQVDFKATALTASIFSVSLGYQVTGNSTIRLQSFPPANTTYYSPILLSLSQGSYTFTGSLKDTSGVNYVVTVWYMTFSSGSSSGGQGSPCLFGWCPGGTWGQIISTFNGFLPQLWDMSGKNIIVQLQTLVFATGVGNIVLGGLADSAEEVRILPGRRR